MLRRAFFAGTLLAAAAVAACASAPDAGDFTRFRYVGQVPGEAPLQVLPPAADRDGNLYVLYSDPKTLLETVFTGRSTGTWIPCPNDTPLGTSGAHGWVGHSDNRIWYWSGNLVRVVLGTTGRCYYFLEFDPSSAARLAFRAVIPSIRETPSRTTVTAMIQSPSDRVPFQVVADLNRGTYSEAREFSPKNATELVVLGVGADPEVGSGVIVVRYKVGDAVKVEARFLDADAKTVEIASVGGLASLPEFGIAGYLQSSDAGLYAGVTIQGELVALDRSGGQLKAVKGMTASGVRRDNDGKLWLAGVAGGRPVIAPIDDHGVVGKPQTWNASLAAAAALRGSVGVLDDRHLPAHATTWKSPKTAIAEFPFLGPQALDPYADDTTLWIIAGPSFDFGGAPKTAIAVSPVGITYP